jgi:hypothetical protein
MCQRRCWDNPGMAVLNNKILGFDSPQTFTFPDHAKLILALNRSGFIMDITSIDIQSLGRQARKDVSKKDFRYLGKLLETIITHPSQFIEHDQLAAFKISLTDFSLDSEIVSDEVPQFFEPFPHDLIEESFKHSSELRDDLWWPPNDQENLACFYEPHTVEGLLDRYHEYVRWEERLSGRPMWQARW